MSRRLKFACAAAVLLTLFRSVLYVFQPQLAFDSDQAVFGLMAKHLVEGRAFPLFMYGQAYLLAVEAWLAAPSFLLFGVSVAALKLPLLLMNVAITLLLIVLLWRESGVDPWLAFVAALFFVVAAPGTSELLLDASGCQVEPFLYVLLLWITRRRPLVFGVILAVGFLQREFTMYGALAIGVIAVAAGEWRRRDAWRDAWRAFRVFAEVWLVVQVLRGFVPIAGPGSALGSARLNSIGVAAQRVCANPGAIAGGIGRLFTVHWPMLFGTAPTPLTPFGMESEATQGIAGSGWMLLALAVICVFRVAGFARTADREWWSRYSFCAYLTLVGLISALAVPLLRCGDVSVMRYDALSVFGLVGLVAWAIGTETRRAVRVTEIAIVVLWALVSTQAHAAVWAEYVGHPRVATKMRIVRALQARGVRYALSDYWIAYYVTFVTDERIIVAAETSPRIQMYADEVGRHRAEAVEISRRPCADGRPPVLEGVYFCPP